MIENRSLPNNIEAERQILSAMILNKDVMYNLIADLDPEVFYHSINKQIFSAMKRFKTIDIAEISDHIVDPDGTLFEIPEICAFRDCTESVKIVRDRFARREAILASMASIGDLYEDFDNSGDEIINTLQSNLYKKISMNNKFQPEHVSKIIPRVLEQLHGANKTDRCISTGINTLDNLLYIDKADLVILGARPSMGKSAIVSQILRHNARRGKTGLFFSIEMSTEMEVKREIFSEGNINYHNYRTGNMPMRDYPKISMGASAIFELPIYIDSEPGITPNKIRSKCNYIKTLGSLDFIIIDYITLCKTDGQSKSLREDVIEIIQELKSIAKYFDIPVVALSQLSREVDKRTDKRPVKSDLMESGAIEATADIILFLYRDYVYTRNEETKNICEVICAKQRNGESDWLKKIYCDLSVGKFADLVDSGF